MQVKIESRTRPVEDLTARIREHRADGKTIDSFLDACVDTAHELHIVSWYFRVDNSNGLGWQIVAVFL